MSLLKTVCVSGWTKVLSFSKQGVQVKDGSRVQGSFYVDVFVVFPLRVSCLGSFKKYMLMFRGQGCQAPLIRVWGLG